MASGWTHAKSKSKSRSAVCVFPVLTSMNRHYVPEWAKDDAGRKMQDRVWESLSRKLNAIQPGCV